MTNSRGRALAIGLWAAFIAAPAVGEAEPLVLTESQMDEVTAGGVFVDVATYAQAFGAYGETYTGTLADSFSSALFELAFGYGVGHARACCGEVTGVNVGTSVAGYGEKVRSGTFNAAATDSRGTAAVGHTVGYIVAYSPPAPEKAREDQQLLNQYTQRVAEEFAQSVAQLASEAAAAGAVPPSRD